MLTGTKWVHLDFPTVPDIEKKFPENDTDVIPPVIPKQV
jgi:hypothetical protein